MTLPTAYATVDDLVGYWRALSDAEQDRATVLLGASADRINELPDAPEFIQSACKWVSLDMVKRAMIGGGGETADSQAMGGMSVSRTYANPMGELYITSREMNRLRGRSGRAAGSVVLSSNVQVPMTPWGYQPSSQVDVIDLVVTPDALTLPVGAIRQLVATVGDSEYQDRTGYATYTTSNSAKATVSTHGLITAIATGTAVITAHYQGLTASCTVTVP